MKNNYNYDMQYLFICMMLTDPELFTRCSNILKPGYFDKKLYPIVYFMHEYANKHNGLPSARIINVEKGTDFSELEKITESDKEWFVETVEKFCRHKAIEQAILKGADLLEKGNYGDLEKMVRDAVLVSLHRELGIDYYENPVERLNKLREQNGDLTTGWQSLDKIIYNVGRGELLIFTAVSGGGKSIALQNLTLNWALQGYDVVYFTLELAEELVAKRIDSMLTGIPNSSIYKNIDNVELQVKKAKHRSGKITIKYMDSGSTPTDIRSYLKEYTIQKEKKPDMIVVDYLDLLNPSSTKIKLDNLFIKDKMVSEEMRNLGSPNNFNLVVASASQINRSGYSESIPGAETMAGGISKQFTSDLTVNIHNTPSLRERGEIEFQLLKTRNSGGVGQLVPLGFNTDTLRIFDDNVNGDSGDNQSDDSNNTQTEKPPKSSGGSESLSDLLNKMKSGN